MNSPQEVKVRPPDTIISPQLPAFHVISLTKAAWQWGLQGFLETLTDDL